MSYQQLRECRELERLAHKLNFVLNSAVENQIALVPQVIKPADDPTGQTVVPHTAWMPYSAQAAIMYGTVNEVLMFLRGVEFAKTYTEQYLNLGKQVQRAQDKMVKQFQHDATIKAITKK
jgi:hypothetical protein